MWIAYCLIKEGAYIHKICLFFFYCCCCCCFEDNKIMTTSCVKILTYEMTMNKRLNDWPNKLVKKTEYPLTLAALVISDTIYFIDRVGKQKQYELNMEISFSI